jgi:diguanylate cyclase (GGDEF)-like protein
VQNNGGLLPEQLARLAATVAGTAMAVISILRRRNDRAPALGTFGLSRDQSSTIIAIDTVLGSGSVLTVVSDVTRDQRFDFRTLISAHPDLCFLWHLRLLSSGGECVGFICVLDRSPRPDLTEAQATSLGQIASIILADRKREQRHLHLMQVADRALQVDRMLRLVSEAISCAHALASLLHALCRDHGALDGRIWQLTQPENCLVEVSRWPKDEPINPQAALGAVTAEAIHLKQPYAITFSRADEVVSEGVASQICVPLWLHQKRFGILLTFATERSNLDSVLADITALTDILRPALLRKVMEERISFAAHHDALTQLSNRLMCRKCLGNALTNAQTGGHEIALLCLDLDGFKSVNDTRGHEHGDKLLVAVAQRLRNNIRDGDTVARMGGDEFTIIQSLGSQPAAATGLARRLLESISAPFELEGQPSLIGVSIGIACYPQDGESSDLLLRNADTALYQAKGAGRNRFQFFDSETQLSQRERLLVDRL